MRQPPQRPTPPRRPPQRRPQRQRTALWDTITAFFLMASVLVIGATVLLLNNPQAPFNPFPKPTLPEVLQVPSPTPVTPSATPTITPTQPTPTPLPTFTASPTASVTPTPTITPTPVVAGAEATEPTIDATLPPEGPLAGDNTPQPGVVVNTPLPNVESDYPFIAPEIRYQANENAEGCQWSSIAGNVTGINGEPLTDLAIEVVGDDFQAIQFTGSAQDFGLAGYEVEVDDRPVTETYAVRLLGPTGLPLSDFINVTMEDTCDQNVTVVDFRQLRPY